MFAILLHPADEETSEAIIRRIRHAIAEIELPDGPQVEIACGWAIDGHGDLKITEQTADTPMIADKQRRLARH